MPPSLVQKAIVAVTASLLALSQTPAFGGPIRGEGSRRIESHSDPASAPFVRRALPPVVAPPGKLGRTYRQLSTPVPEDEHPRIGTLEICNVPAGDIHAQRPLPTHRPRQLRPDVEMRLPRVPADTGADRVSAVLTVRRHPVFSSDSEHRAAVRSRSAIYDSRHSQNRASGHAE